MSDEHIDVLDEHGNHTGTTAKRSAIHAQGLWHHTVHIWVCSPDAHILFQRRSPHKDIFPDMYDLSAGGHISTGETPSSGAVRELKEELGIDATEDDLEFIGRYKFSTQIQNWTHLHNEFIYVFLYVTPTDTQLTLQEDEVSAAEWLPLERANKEIHDAELSKRYVTVHGYSPSIVKLLHGRFVH